MIASVIGFITALMAIAYTTKLMQGTLFAKTDKPNKSHKSSRKDKKQDLRKRREARSKV